MMDLRSVIDAGLVMIGAIAVLLMGLRTLLPSPAPCPSPKLPPARRIIMSISRRSPKRCKSDRCGTMRGRRTVERWSVRS